MNQVVMNENYENLSRDDFYHHKIRYFRDKAGDLWFVGNDIGNCIGLKRATNSIRLLDPKNRGFSRIRLDGQWKNSSVINVKGVRELIERSKKKDLASHFLAWFVDNFLPRILEEDNNKECDNNGGVAMTSKTNLPANRNHGQYEIKQMNFNGVAIRSVIFNGDDLDPWFIASDVCSALGIGNPTDVVNSLDHDEKSTLDIIEGGPHNQGGPARLIISESGVYAMLGKSRKAKAKEFQRWVRKEVLPSIRKTGEYKNPKSNGKINHSQMAQVANQKIDDKHLRAISNKLSKIGESKLFSARKRRKAMEKSCVILVNADSLDEMLGTENTKFVNTVDLGQMIGDYQGREIADMLSANGIHGDNDPERSWSIQHEGKYLYDPSYVIPIIQNYIKQIKNIVKIGHKQNKLF